MDLSNIEIDIFVHDIMNPPHEDAGSKVVLNLQNSMGLIKVVPKSSELNQSHYSVLITKPTIVGFTNSEQHILQRELDDFILAINLVLLRGCAVRTKTEFKAVKFVTSHKDIPSNVEKNEKVTSVHIFENIDIRNHVSIEVTTSDTLSESELIDTFKNLKKFKRCEGKVEKRENNLALALKLFEAAISDFQRLFKFKNFYNSLELIINIKGRELLGSDLDNAVSKSTGFSYTYAKELRELYIRTKHVHRNTKDITTFTKGIIKLPQMTIDIRRSLQNLIKAELK